MYFLSSHNSVNNSIEMILLILLNLQKWSRHRSICSISDKRFYRYKRKK